MPIYMDRHDIEGATPETIAEAHQKDIALQDEYGIKLLTYWFDGQRGSVFCLVDSPSEQNIRDLHEHAHGDVPNEIIPVDPDQVQVFLGRITDPVPPPEREEPSPESFDAAFRGVMFTDLAGSTEMTSRLGDTRAMELLRVHNSLTREAVRSHAGREVKHTGDGFMVSFGAVEKAVDCAVAIQQAFAAYNTAHPDETLQVRIGLSAGEPVEEDGDLFGSTVQLAARICNLADPSVILTDSRVQEHCQPGDRTFSDRGRSMMKGLPEPVQVYEVGWR